MFGIFSKGSEDKSNIWNTINSNDDLQALIKESYSRPIVIFKHSTRCSISSMAMNRVESSWTDIAGDYPISYLDLIKFRSVSNQIAEDLKVEHQSPQVIVVHKGEAIYNASHNSINSKDIYSVIQGK
jgi:bacillithiol system protein YtxJ